MRLEGPSARLTLSGTANVPAREYDLKGIASLISAPPTRRPAFELPFVIQGPWDDPLVLPDSDAPDPPLARLGAAARRGARQPLLVMGAPVIPSSKGARDVRDACVRSSSARPRGARPRPRGERELKHFRNWLTHQS